jgi:serine/threonine-protein kinase RsbW/stage II sporulation protein AB (anti-sigma F factor)
VIAQHTPGKAVAMPFSEWEPELDASYPAQPSQVPAIRRAVAEVARARGAEQHTVVQITLAVSEAATNAVLHAYRGPAADRPGDVRVVVRAEDESALIVQVRDHGIGPLPRSDSPGLGLGMSLMAHDADAFEIRPVPEGGTEVVLRFEL